MTYQTSLNGDATSHAAYDGSHLYRVGWVQVTQYRGRCWSAADAFLQPVMRRSNLHVLTGVQCTLILGQSPQPIEDLHISHNEGHSVKERKSL